MSWWCCCCGVVCYSAGFMKSRRKNKNVSLAVRSSADAFFGGKEWRRWMCLSTVVIKVY
jgi:hypothetical protein